MADTLTALLLACSDPALVGQAQQQLAAMEQANYPTYLGSLIAEMGSEGKPHEARQRAGLLLKNTLVAKSEETKREQAQRWVAVDPSMRSSIKQMLLSLLAAPPKEIRSTAALAIASIAAIDIPRNEWPDLISLLVHNINSTAADTKQSSFEALGYICEECGEHLQAQSNLILNAINTGMSDTANADIRYAATSALANSLSFVESNMNNEQERNVIMGMVFAAAASTDERVRVAAFSCLVTMGSEYYKYLQPYMVQIFQLTGSAIGTEVEDVQLQAIEFWSTLADVEIEFKVSQRTHRAAEAASRHTSSCVLQRPPLTYHSPLVCCCQEETENPDRSDEYVDPSKQYVAAAIVPLVPQLLNCLTKQNEDVDDETWNPAMAAGTCLSLLSQAAGDAIVPVVLPFIQGNINSPNWRQKEAATISFGCILDGPQAPMIAELVKSAFPVLLTNMRDAHDLVKDTAAWTVGRICSLHPETTQPFLDHLMSAFIHGLEDVPSVASNVCWAIHNLANALPYDVSASSNAMSPYFQPLMERLLNAANRADAGTHNLLSSAYEAINALISSAAKDTWPIVSQLIPVFIKQLEGTLVSSALSATDRERQNEVQALLCGAMQTIVQRLDEATVLTYADLCMTLFIKVQDSKSSTVNEESLMAIGALANRMGGQFEKYMQALDVYLERGLQNEREYKVCQVAVGLVGDLARALEGKFVPLSDKIMSILLQHLSSATIERSVKPHIISCLGDIALAVGGYFARYLPFVFRILIPASELQFDFIGSTFDDVDYLDSLRESILEAWTGILQGLAADNQQEQFIAPLQPINAQQSGGQPVYPLVAVCKMLDLIADWEETGEVVTRAACGLVGDLCSVLGVKVKEALVRRQSIAQLIKKGNQKGNEQATRQAAQWAQSELAELSKQ